MKPERLQTQVICTLHDKFVAMSHVKTNLSRSVRSVLSSRGVKRCDLAYVKHLIKFCAYG